MNGSSWVISRLCHGAGKETHMAEELENSNAFIERFRAHLSRLDELVHVVLNAHCDTEAALDSFLNVMFYNPQHLEDARLTYLQKTHISRAYNELSNNRPEWQLMLVLNALRN